VSTSEDLLAAAARINPYLGLKLNDGHVEVACDGVDCHDGRGCMFCVGGLFACRVCDSFEGATTTFCPGRPLTKKECDAVYAGELDYRAGAWVEGPSIHTPALWAMARKELA
jgi:hypothetical protein